MLSGVPLGSQRGGPLEALQGGLASPLPVRSPDAHPPPWENGLRGLRGGTPPPSGPRAYTGPRLTLGWGLAPLQSPPSQQGADRTLTLRPGPGPGPLHISIRLLAFLLGSCQPGRRAAGVCGRGRGRRASPTVKKPWFPAHAPERRRTATHQVPVPDTLRVHPLHSPRTLSRRHAAETLPQRERHPASDSGRRGTDRVPGGPARPPLRIGPVPQPRAGGPLSLQDPRSRGCFQPGVPSQPQEEVKFKACALHLKMHTKARSPKTHSLSK